MTSLFDIADKLIRKLRERGCASVRRPSGDVVFKIPMTPGLFMQTSRAKDVILLIGGFKEGALEMLDEPPCMPVDDERYNTIAELLNTPCA